MPQSDPHQAIDLLSERIRDPQVRSERLPGKEPYRKHLTFRPFGHKHLTFLLNGNAVGQYVNKGTMFQLSLVCKGTLLSCAMKEVVTFLVLAAKGKARAI